MGAGLVNQFLSMLMLVFATASGVAGVFTVYFGSGKSRLVGALFIILGILVFVIFLIGAGLLEWLGGNPRGIIDFQNTIMQGILSIIGGIVGAILALGIFLILIMKV